MKSSKIEYGTHRGTRGFDTSKCDQSHARCPLNSRRGLKWWKFWGFSSLFPNFPAMNSESWEDAEFYNWSYFISSYRRKKDSGPSYCGCRQGDMLQPPFANFPVGTRLKHLLISRSPLCFAAGIFAASTCTNVRYIASHYAPWTQ